MIDTRELPRHLGGVFTRAYFGKNASNWSLKGKIRPNILETGQREPIEKDIL